MPRKALDEVEAALVASRYYLMRHSQVQIAADLDMSRFHVARLLEYAIEHNIVEFRVNDPLTLNSRLSERLQKQFKLHSAVVVGRSEAKPDDENIQRQLIARAAARLLSDQVTNDDILGIGWGRTLSAMSREITTLANCRVVQLGGMAGSVMDNSLELVRRISEVGAEEAYPLFLPLLAKDAETAAALRQRSLVKDTMKWFEHISIATVAVGSWDPPESQMQRSLDPELRETLHQRGVVAEVLGTLFRSDGSIVHDIEDRTNALTYEQMVKIPEMILVAGGNRKVNAVRAVLKADIGTTLVTDVTLANALLRQNRER